MAKPLTHTFTPEALRTFDKKKVETIRENALRLGADDLVEMCDLDLAERKPVVASRSSTPRVAGGSTRRLASDSTASRANMFVSGYHVVSESELGIVDLGDGRFWSHAVATGDADPDLSVNGGAYLALHKNKTVASHRQGKIIGFRKVADGDVEGVEFLVDAEPKSRAWVGAGSGEVGFKWAKLR